MYTIFKIILSFLLLTITCNVSASSQKLTIGLDWFINPDHAPLIIAKKRNFFRDLNLEVEMIEPADPNDPPKLVAAGKLDLAISYQPQLHIQVDQGLPVVRVGTLVSVPLNSLVVLRDGPIRTISDLTCCKVLWFRTRPTPVLRHRHSENARFQLHTQVLVSCLQ